MIEVMPFGSPSMLHDEEWANGVGPASGWETFVARDVVHAIDTRYRTIASADGRAIAGLSEGAYGALNVGLHHAGEFDVIESWSGYVWADHIDRIFGQDRRVLDYNSPMLSVNMVASALRADHAYIWFYVGTKDKLLWENEQFAGELGRLGIAHRFFVGSGAHSWSLWRRFTGEGPLGRLGASGSWLGSCGSLPPWAASWPA
jgi:S-formylglutathione hydrolase FrmB